jgi:hypothetical protein
MAVVIALGIAAVVVAFVAAPFFLLEGSGPDAGVQAKDPDAAVALADLLAEKETVYAAIQELDFDFKSGKLSAEDHAALRQRQEEHAAAILKRLDDLQGKAQEVAGARVRRERRK